LHTGAIVGYNLRRRTRPKRRSSSDPRFQRREKVLTPVKTSVVIPCYNAERTLGDSLRKLTQFLEARAAVFAPFEVIAVDDGSRDGTARIVREQFPEVKLLRHEQNRGKGAAVRTGMLAAQGTYRFFTDADMPFDLDALDAMLYYLHNREVDICIGSRNREQLKPLVKRTQLRYVASYIYTAFVSRLIVTGVRDTQCGLKGFRAEIAEYLFRNSRVENFAFDVEILYLAFKNDLDVKRVPARLVSEDYSSVSVFRHSPIMLGSILMVLHRYHRGQYPMMPPRELPHAH